MRAAVIKYLIDSGEWEAAYSGVGRFIRDVDPQGSSMAYDFSGSPIGPLAFEPSIEPTYQMPSTLDAMLYVYCNPAAPGPAYWGSTQYLVRFARPWLWPASTTRGQTSRAMSMSPGLEELTQPSSLRTSSLRRRTWSVGTQAQALLCMRAVSAPVGV